MKKLINRNWTIETLSEKVGVSESTIKNDIKKPGKMPLSRAVKWAEVLEINICEIIKIVRDGRK